MAIHRFFKGVDIVKDKHLWHAHFNGVSVYADDPRKIEADIQASYVTDDAALDNVLYHTLRASECMDQYMTVETGSPDAVSVNRQLKLALTSVWRYVKNK